MLGSMETPAHERRDIEGYLRSQSGPNFEIEHVEKLTSEYVLGNQYDVWDAHTKEGRWWVITNPTNLYSQEHIKSMDVALSFHIGLWSRVQGRESHALMDRDQRVRALLRRLDVASESLDRAKEVEDFQAVGMRLRELLLTLTFGMSELVQTSDPIDQFQKAADFKALANIYARSIAGGKSSKHLRSLLTAISENAWNYVSWLTHARSATEHDARIAFAATHAVVEMFLQAVVRVQRGKLERCPMCTSYRLQLVRSEDGNSWVKLCEVCGYGDVADAPAVDARSPEPDQEREPLDGDCVEVEDFGIYLTPSQAQMMLESARNRVEVDDTDDTGGEEVQPIWANPFAYFLDDTLIDVHRMVFMTFKHPPSPGHELVYQCDETSCVNAEHAIEQPLSNEQPWRVGVIEKATLHSSFIELQIGIADQGVQRVLTKNDILDRYGFGDASSLIERPVFVTASSDEGWVRLIPAARRVDYGHGSPVPGQLSSSDEINGT